MELVTKAKNKHTVVIPNNTHTTDQINWCVELFGPCGTRGSKDCRWRFGWTDKISRFHFRSKNDAIWFMMKWS